MKKVLFVFIFLVSFPSLIFAASHYIRSGATGTSCSDWGQNACNALPQNLIRGDVYYIAGGNYAGRDFTTPTSNTLLITIKGATKADHGTDIGWSNNYSVETKQAVWSSGISFSTSYWVFDGSVGPVWSKNPVEYGFTFNSNLAYPISVGADRTNTTNFHISHVSATAPKGDIEKIFLVTGNTWGETDNVTLSHSYFNGWQGVWMATSPMGPAHFQDNWVCEYNVVLNTSGSAAHHAESLNNNYGTMKNMIARYTLFEGTGGGITGIICANNADNIGAKIYGNVFKDLRAGNGIITGTSAGDMVSPEVYNNTFINCNDGSTGAWIGGSTTGTPLVYNNLLYNMVGAMAVRGDYNAYFDVRGAPTETHGQIVSGNPFVNLTSEDFHLKTQTDSGKTLLNPYNMDMDKKVRGGSADKIWTRGAFQFGIAASSNLVAPQNLRVVSP